MMKSVPRWTGDRLRRYFVRGLRDNWRATLELCEAHPGATILDIGCGDGEFSVMVAQKVGAAKTIGVDAVPKNLSAARARGMLGIEGNLEDGIPVEDASVDLVVASHVIEHVSDTDLFVKEIYRVLRGVGGEQL